jgi:hypothetical protein
VAGMGKFGLLNIWRPMKDEEFNGWNTNKKSKEFCLKNLSVYNFISLEI